MKLQVLVSTMNQDDHSILEKMKITSDAIIVNQCDINKLCEFQHKGRNIKFLSFAERGIGLSRNNALMRTTEEFCLFGDDDVVYGDDYEKIIIDAFNKNPKADIILFNLPSTNIDRPTAMIKKNGKVHLWNCMRYGAVKIAARTESIKKKNIYFSLLFGGGAKYSCGEDSLFIIDCVKSGLNVYKDTSEIGIVKQEDSTWFRGYTDKFFMDKGAFFAAVSKRWAYFLCLQFVLRKHKLFEGEKNVSEAFKLMIKGVKGFYGGNKQ